MKEALAFKMNKTNYCIDLENLIEIVNLHKVCWVPNCSEYMDGIVDIRGNIIPVLNLFKLCGLEEPENPETEYLLIVREEERTFGLRVDNVETIIKTEHMGTQQLTMLDDTLIKQILKEENGDIYIDLNVKDMISKLSIEVA